MASKLALALLLTILCSVSQAETYSVCENCVLTDANADIFEAHYPGDYTGYASMSYFNPEVTDTKTGQIIGLTLKKYECHEAKKCYHGLTQNSEVTIYGGTDPLKTYDENAEYKTVYVPVRIKLGGQDRVVDCSLGQTLDPKGKYGYSYKYGVNVNCVFDLGNYVAFNFNLHFKRNN